VTGILFGIGAAIGFGFADYAAAMATRRVGVVRTSLGMQATGLLCALAVVAVRGGRPITAPLVVYGLALGVLGVLTLAALYRALAFGPIAVVSPIVASHAAFAVLIIVAVLGERLTPGQVAAMACTFVGVVVASTDPRRSAAASGLRGPGVRLGMLAMAGASILAAVFAIGVRATEAIALVAAIRVTSTLAIAGWAATRRVGLGPLRDVRALGLVALVGLLDTGASILLALGVESGYASFVVTGTGAYPLIPAVLGIAVLREQLARTQYFGVLIVVIGLVALGMQT